MRYFLIALFLLLSECSRAQMNMNMAEAARLPG